MRTLKTILTVMAILIGIGVSAALIYFLTIIGGVAIMGFLIFVLVSEYYRSPEPEKEKE